VRLAHQIKGLLVEPRKLQLVVTGAWVAVEVLGPLVSMEAEILLVLVALGEQVQ